MITKEQADELVAQYNEQAGTVTAWSRVKIISSRGVVDPVAYEGISKSGWRFVVACGKVLGNLQYEAAVVIDKPDQQQVITMRDEDAKRAFEQARKAQN